MRNVCKYKMSHMIAFTLLLIAILLNGCGRISTASLKWRFQTEGPVTSSPAVVDGVIYVGSHDHSVYAMDAESGELKWRFETEGDVYSSPAVADDVVYVGSNDKSLYAIDTDTGELIWRFETEADVGSIPSVVDSMVFVGDNEGNLYAIDVAGGELKWSTPTMPSYTSSFPSPMVSGDYVYFGSRINLYIFEKETGEPIQREGCTGEIINTDSSQPVVVDGMIYLGSFSSLVAYVAENCKMHWAFDTDGFVLSIPSVVQNVVYFVSGDGYLYAVGTKNGELKWKSYIGLNKSHSPFSSPIVADGVVYVGSSSGLVFAMSADTGESIWLYKTGGSVFSTPAVADGVVYVGSGDGYLYAMEAYSNNQELAGHDE